MTEVRVSSAEPKRPTMVFNSVVKQRGNDHILCDWKMNDPRLAHHQRSHPKQVRHVGLEHRVLGQVINDVKRERQVGGEQAGPVGEASSVVQEEALGRVFGEPALAQLDGGPGDIQPDVGRIVG